MKTVQLALTGYMLAMVLLWLTGGFIAMDWDPRNWHEGSRLAMVWLSLIGAISAAMSERTP